MDCRILFPSWSCGSKRSLGMCGSSSVAFSFGLVIWPRSSSSILPASRPCPSRRNQSTVNVDVIGPFWCGMNNPSSLDLSLFLDSYTVPWREVSFPQIFLSSRNSCPSVETFPLPFLGMCSFHRFSTPFSYAKLGSPLLSVVFCCGPPGSIPFVWWCLHHP
jgi:hypothetical protein